MKKKASFLLFALPFLVLSGCGKKEEEKQPQPDATIDQTGLSIFPKHHRGSGYVGDPMPYYENGKMYVYYLEDARNYGGGGFHPISLLETTDFAHYEDKGIMLDFVDDRYSIEFALATGSVIKDKTGKYHFFYGGYNDNLSFTGQPYAQTILHATSTDLYTWTKDPTFNGTGFIIGQANDFRDPYVLYMEESNEYWMLITSREGGSASVLKYTSPDLLHWTKQGSFFKTGRFNNMECSSLIKWNGYWYYSFSENGDHGYTKFFAKKNLSDADWIEIPTIDGFYAGRPVIGQNNRLFLYGWCPTKGLYDSVKPDWAGNLTMLELTQKSGSAELNTVLAKEIKDKIAHPVEYKYTFGKEVVKEVNLEKSNKIVGKAIDKMGDKRITRVSFDLSVGEKTGRTGITFANKVDNELGSIAFDFNITKGTFNFYNACSNNTFGTGEYGVLFNFEANTKYHVEIITEDGVTGVFLNDEVSLIMRTMSITRNSWGFYAQGVASNFSEVNFYE